MIRVIIAFSVLSAILLHVNSETLKVNRMVLNKPQFIDLFSKNYFQELVYEMKNQLASLEESASEMKMKINSLEAKDEQVTSSVVDLGTKVSKCIHNSYL